MKTRPVDEITRDLIDADDRLHEFLSCGGHDVLAMRMHPDSARLMLESHVTFYKDELEEATRHGVQLPLGL